MTALFIEVTTNIFTCLCLDAPIYFNTVVVFFIPFFGLLYAICIIPPFGVTLKIRHSIKQLIKKNDGIKADLWTRYKMNYIVEGMKYADSFTCFEFFNIKSMLLVWVREYFS